MYLSILSNKSKTITQFLLIIKTLEVAPKLSKRVDIEKIRVLCENSEGSNIPKFRIKMLCLNDLSGSGAKKEGKRAMHSKNYADKDRAYRGKTPDSSKLKIRHFRGIASVVYVQLSDLEVKSGVALKPWGGEKQGEDCLWAGKRTDRLENRSCGRVGQLLQLRIA